MLLKMLIFSLLFYHFPQIDPKFLKIASILNPIFLLEATRSPGPIYSSTMFTALLINQGFLLLFFSISIYMLWSIFSSGYFSFSFVSTSLAYISIPKTKEKLKLPEIKN